MANASQRKRDEHAGCHRASGVLACLLPLLLKLFPGFRTWVAWASVKKPHQLVPPRGKLVDILGHEPEPRRCTVWQQGLHCAFQFTWAQIFRLHARRIREEQDSFSGQSPAQDIVPYNNWSYLTTNQLFKIHPKLTLHQTSELHIFPSVFSQLWANKSHQFAHRSPQGRILEGTKLDFQSLGSHSGVYRVWLKGPLSSLGQAPKLNKPCPGQMLGVNSCRYTSL